MLAWSSSHFITRMVYGYVSFRNNVCLSRRAPQLSPCTGLALRLGDDQRD